MEKLRKKGSPDKEMGMKLDSYGRVEITCINTNIEKLLRITESNPWGCGGGCRGDEPNSSACGYHC